ncbi:Arc family DNA-binding protein [Brenneria tiliae]|uniref:Arc family DNA-binding protein n=1 Tax=Brenneria tiliae TaxID=2914984 RepID=A0ABT0MYI2_9GAMM|nr:Arc family DNA-binding protein [Brenneria tiliae]MCL2894901.1 Arc family DNA-binding protein [Brenneria tiliae]
MSEISSLSLKIPLDLKEKIKAAALENEVSISAEVTARLLQSFAKGNKAPTSATVDNQHTEEAVEDRLTQKEIKKIRALLKDKAKGTSRKK